jgi:hypothetical protein
LSTLREGAFAWRPAGLRSCNEEGQAPVEVETFLLEVDRGALGGIDSEAAAEFQLADRLQGLVDAAGCVGSCFVAEPAARSGLLLWAKPDSWRARKLIDHRTLGTAVSSSLDNGRGGLSSRTLTATRWCRRIWLKAVVSPLAQVSSNCPDFVELGLMECPAETYGSGRRVDLSTGVRIGSPHGLVRMYTIGARRSRRGSPRRG